MKHQKVIIKYEGPNEVMVWKHTCRDFGADTDVIVPFSHEVIFIKEGEMLDTLLPGKHTLNAGEKDKRRFGIFRKAVPETVDCQVYFVNKTVTLTVKWGTPQQMELFDPFLKIPVHVGANGSFDVRVGNSRKFLSKVVGNTEGLTINGLGEFFKDKLLMHIKDIIANAMVTSGINFYELSTKLLLISNVIKDSVRNMFEDYGIEIVDFVINQVVIPEGDRRELEAIIKRKRVLEMSDSSFKQEEEKAENRAKFAADTAVRLAEIQSKNEGAKSVVINCNAEVAQFCPQCGAKLDIAAAFCNKCGAKVK